MCVFALAIVARVAQIQFIEGEKWKGKAESQTTAFRTIEATRGNIFSTDGSLLATSEPIYEIRWDANVPALTDEYFNEHITRNVSRIAFDTDRVSSHTYIQIYKCHVIGSMCHLT